MISFLGFVSGLMAWSVLWGVPTASGGHSPFAVFDKHQADILSSPRSLYQGYVFATGSARAITHDSSSVDRARQKARTKAQGNLALVTISRTDWPESIRKSKVGDNVAKIFESQSSGDIFAERMQSVFDHCQEKECVYVVAVPESGLQENREISWESALNVLDQDFEQGRLRLPLSDYLEICSPARRGRVLSALEMQIQVQYGAAAAAVIEGRDIDEIPLLWSKGKRLAAEKVSELDQDSLLQLLNLDPYDPVVLYYLASTFKTQGRHRFSSLLFSRGTVWFIDPPYNLLCWESTAPESRASGRHKRGVPIENLREVIVDAFSEQHPPQDGLTTLIVESAGTLPLADRTTNEGLGRVEMSNIVEFISTFPSSHKFSALANFYLEKGDEIRALPFALQAAKMNNQYEVFAENLLERVFHDQDIQHLPR